ncbi:hypothetical protein HaLaN_00979 [Haematococcus lacustris]|uniref:Uncharacterized protein n=1 Tax=Haematococcus lacustris TaxID=44745 RepID=A0A699YTI3_HAELA|nr:hypothetical protein HaLaN_00979 [Haematococcus lacustris]
MVLVNGGGWCTAEGEIWVLLKWTNYVLKFGDGPECLYNGDKGHWEPLREAFEDGARNKMYKAWKARKPGWYANQAAATHHVGSSDGEEDSHLGKTSAKKQRLSLGAARVK